MTLRRDPERLAVVLICSLLGCALTFAGAPFLLAGLLGIGQAENEQLAYILGLGLLSVLVGCGLVLIAWKNRKAPITPSPSTFATAPPTSKQESGQPDRPITLDWLSDSTPPTLEADRKIALGMPQSTHLEESEVQALTAIQKRFEQLLQERIPSSYHPNEWPSVLSLAKSGRRDGGFPFPYGGASCSLVGCGSDVKLHYRDHLRITDGWGRHYEISATDTTLLDEGLD